MTRAVEKYEYTRGATITFGLRATPSPDGSSVVQCDIKPAKNGAIVPSDDTPVTATPSVVFVAASGDVPAHWLFTLSAAQSAEIEAGIYITDAKITTGSLVTYILPVLIEIGGRVTA